eukprot:1034319-Lingulodinium_polyedra.AAC.1
MARARGARACDLRVVAAVGRRFDRATLRNDAVGPTFVAAAFRKARVCAFARSARGPVFGPRAERASVRFAGRCD